ncbi:MAG: 50S ribosomal protein L10 [Thermofilaceae archaeon]
MRALTSLRVRASPPSKVAKLQNYSELLSKYNFYLVIDVTGIPASALHMLRRKLMERGAVLKVIKNKVFLKALQNLGRGTPDKLVTKLTGQNAVIFTNENPFSLALFLLKEYKMTRKAMPNDIATSDIVVPSGNTGIAPGPSMSLFGKLKIPIRVMEGTIWVVSDTIVARKGDIITPELAELLGKLNIKPIEITIPIKMISIDGRIVEPGEVSFEPEYYSKLLAEAQQEAINLAINAYLPLPEVIHVLISRAVAQADALAVAQALPLPGVIERSLSKAYLQASALYNLLKQQNPNFA